MMLTKSDGRVVFGWLRDEKKERLASACKLSLHFARICYLKRRPEVCQRNSLGTICRLLRVAARVDIGVQNSESEFRTERRD